MLGTCKTCKYWANSFNPKNGISDCDMPDDKDKTKSFDIEVSMDDNSGLSVYLMTGENFGCVLHSPKSKS